MRKPLPPLRHLPPHLLAYLLSRGLYSFAFAAVPVLLSISAAQDGYDSSEIGLILGLGALPAVFGGLLAPVLLYSISQRRLFSAITVMWIAVAGACALYAQGHRIPLPGYIGVSFFVELAGAVMIPTMGSFLPQIVGEGSLAKVNAIQSFALGICSAVGPAAVSVSIVLLDASSMWLMLAGLMALSLLLQRRLPDVAPTKPAGMLSNLLADGKYVVATRPLLYVIVGSALWHFVVWSLFMTQGPVAMRDQYGSSWAWGFLQSIFSVGSIVGSLITVPGRFRTARVCLLSLLPFCLVPVELALGAPLPVIGVSVALGSLAIAAASVRWSTALQRSVPSEHLAGVFAFDYVLSEGISPVGFILMPMLCSQSVVGYVLVGLTMVVLVVLSAGSATRLGQGR